jgi:hypothetical protein
MFNVGNIGKSTTTLATGAINSVSKAANSVTSTLTTAVNSALGTVNSAASSAVSAVNSATTSTVSALNSAATSTVSAANSAVKNAIPSANSLMPFNNSHKNSKNSGMNNFKNAFNNSQNSNNSQFNSAASAKSSAISSYGTIFGVFLFLVGIFLVSMFVFQNEFNVAWNYLVTSFRKLFNMDAPTNNKPEDKTDKEERDVTTAPPSSVDTAAAANSKSASLLSKILPMGSKEVFNVSVNDYTYYDAEPLCLALGAELANYEQVKESWNKGADWCNYGWTKGQLAVYPTQKETWEKLQHGPPDQKGACGRPGVNGGYFDNPEMRFGVNCYGVKPDQSANDERLLMENGTIPRTASTLKMDKQIQDIKNNLDTIGILPFSSSKWSA